MKNETMSVMFQSQETIGQSHEMKTRLAEVKEKQFFHLLQVQLNTLLQMTAPKICFLPCNGE